MEAIVAAAVFLLFAVGIYSGLSLVFKIVYQSRIKILETAILSEQLEVARNLSYEDVGILNGVPAGLLERTKTITRNNLNFLITATVRNIDDAFDGTIGSNPIDTSPADYKLVEMSAICFNCGQAKPIKLSTMVSPRQLEGASDNGALFIRVFDQAGLPVSGADVRIVNTGQNPDLIIDDTTDSDGYLRVVDTPTGTLAYNINVSKSGYSSDYTTPASEFNPSPVKQPSNVNSQEITDVSFSIDRVGSVNVSTLNFACSAVPDVSLSARGKKMLGVDPDVYKYNQNFSTDGAGTAILDNLEFDEYHISATGSIYDVAGVIPLSPIKLNAGENQNVSVVLQPNTANSLLVVVKDAGSGLPLSDATVRLTGGIDRTLITGRGYSGQTDWSGGSEQSSYLDFGRYFSDNGNVDVATTPGVVLLRKSGSKYVADGMLESSTFDFGTSTVFRNIVINPTFQPAYQAGTNALKFQLATSNSSSPATWNFVGPNGTASTYFTVSNTTIPSSLSNKRYLRYRAFLHTDNTNYTAQLQELAITNTSACMPPGQVFFGGLSNTTYNISTTRSGYATLYGDVVISGDTDTVINMSPL